MMMRFSTHSELACFVQWLLLRMQQCAAHIYSQSHNHSTHTTRRVHTTWGCHKMEHASNTPRHTHTTYGLFFFWCTRAERISVRFTRRIVLNFTAFARRGAHTQTPPPPFGFCASPNAFGTNQMEWITNRQTERHAQRDAPARLASNVSQQHTQWS